MNPLTYFFETGKAEGNRELRNLLGGKGAGLAEMANLGLPVPAGFTITTDSCLRYYDGDPEFIQLLQKETFDSVTRLEKVTGKTFGSGDQPLLLSVRSGARASMPGMMDTVLNIGLTAETVESLGKLAGDRRTEIERQLGEKLDRGEYIFYVARSGDLIDGYALFDRQIGQHEYIDFATFFDVQGRVTRVEVVAYREPYGDGIRSKRFRNQFVGKEADSGFRPGHDIDVISGATLSARAMARAVKRATLLLHDTLLTSS